MFAGFFAMICAFFIFGFLVYTVFKLSVKGILMLRLRYEEMKEKRLKEKGVHSDEVEENH